MGAWWWVAYSNHQERPEQLVLSYDLVSIKYKLLCLVQF